MNGFEKFKIFAEKVGFLIYTVVCPKTLIGVEAAASSEAITDKLQGIG